MLDQRDVLDDTNRVATAAMGTHKLNVLTSLRFFAAAVVALGHSSPLFQGDSKSHYVIPSYNGVTFFFVLSGFILTCNYFRLDSAGEIRRFAVARFARLWPLHFTAFLLSLALLPDVRAELLTPFGLGAAAMNLSMTHALAPLLAFQFSYNAVSWSISAECFFYICFIGLIKLVHKPFSRLFWVAFIGPVAMMLLSLALNLPLYDPDHFNPSGNSTIYIHPFTRIFDFILGMIAATYFIHKKLEPDNMPSSWVSPLEIAAVALMLSTAALTYSTYASVFPQLPPMVLFWLERAGSAPIYAVAISVLAFERGIVSRLLSRRPYVLLGEISFALYLVHQIFLRWILSNAYIQNYISGNILLATFWAASLIASYFLWRLIEIPARAYLIRSL